MLPVYSVRDVPGSYHRRPSPWPSPRLRGEGMVAAEPFHTSAKHALSSGAKFFTPNRCTLQLNMLFGREHVFHAEPFDTSAKHALGGGQWY